MRKLVLPLFLLVLVACATDDMAGEKRDGPRDKPRSRYSGEEGESAVGAIPDVVLRDDARNKDVQITVEYPTRGGPSPLIVFSHGFGGSNRGYVGLSSYWASQGYVVIRPRHADSGKLRDLESLDDIWESQSPKDWQNRVQDVAFILDSLDRIEERFPELKGKIDRAKIGVGGHSYGAHTAMLIGGAKTYPGPVRYADPRVRAIVAMSPQGTAEDRGLTRQSWDEVRIPALYMTGSRDRGVSEAETPEWRRQAFELSPAGDKWFISVEGARHASFSGRLEQRFERREEMDLPASTLTPPEGLDRSGGRQGRFDSLATRQREIFRKIKVSSLEFWDAYLKDSAEGREALGKTQGQPGLMVEKK